ncbi:MAG: hypothetical protein AB1921_02475 [Thermodesulfobacteriota bacterium]
MMKKICFCMAFVLVAAIAAPAMAQDAGKIGLGVMLTLEQRDLKFDSYSNSQGVGAGVITEMDRFYDYNEETHLLALQGSYGVTDWFTVRGILGLADYLVKADYFGTQGYSNYQIKDDFKDVQYGLGLDFAGPVTEKLSLGVSITGIMGYHREATTDIIPPANSSRQDISVERYTVDVFPKAIYDLGKLDVWAGPTYTMSNVKAEITTYTAAGNVYETLKLKEDKPVGLRLGASYAFSDNVAGSLEIGAINATNGAVSLTYFF